VQPAGEEKRVTLQTQGTTIAPRCAWYRNGVLVGLNKREYKASYHVCLIVDDVMPGNVCRHTCRTRLNK
jgi:hypothetical protein